MDAVQTALVMKLAATLLLTLCVERHVMMATFWMGMGVTQLVCLKVTAGMVYGNLLRDAMMATQCRAMAVALSAGLRCAEMVCWIALSSVMMVAHLHVMAAVSVARMRNVAMDSLTVMRTVTMVICCLVMDAAVPASMNPVVVALWSVQSNVMTATR